MELRHLRYFVAVAEELNFTRAAEKLRLAQPSLTRQIHNLEAELGVRLLDRSRNQVSLTEEGRSFLADARRLVALSLESVKSVQQLSRGESGQLNIVYLFKFNFSLLPETLATFYQTCPEIAVNVFDMSPAEQLRALEARKIDLGFVGLRPPTTGRNLAALAWERVAYHNVVAVLPENHPLAKRNKIKLSDLKPMFFVAMSEETHPGSRAWLSGLCESAGFTPRILQGVELETGLMTFVAEGLGVTLAREQIKNLPHPGVVFRPLTAALTADYWIAWHQENRSHALLRYIEVVKKRAALGL
ncbi:MAG TPA: LysR substrate-binding domain-containing protein [Verrucomicrobiae bacterium]|nr:LysR substrate-binding domain-containing protein [Verrucomicrobiae bacterium]